MIKLPSSRSLRAWARLPGWQRASVAWDLAQAIEGRRKRSAAGGLSESRQRSSAVAQRRDRALLSLLLAVDPHLERHLARYERSIRGG